MNKENTHYVKMPYPENKPGQYGRYHVFRKDGKEHFETWNGGAWAYNNNEIRFWLKEEQPPPYPENYNQLLNKITELLLFCEDSGYVVNGFRTKDIINDLRNLTKEQPPPPEGDTDKRIEVPSGIAVEVNKFIHNECIEYVPHDIGWNTIKLINEILSRNQQQKDDCIADMDHWPCTCAKCKEAERGEVDYERVLGGVVPDWERRASLFGDITPGDVFKAMKAAVTEYKRLNNL